MPISSAIRSGPACCSGASAFTYGAAGVFQANDREAADRRYRPDGGAFDAAFWDDAMHFPGAEQIAKGHALLKRLGYHRFTVHPEWASAARAAISRAYRLPVRAFAAGIGRGRVIYVPLRWYQWDAPLVRALEPGVRYRAAYLTTDTLERHELGTIAGDANGEWRGPVLPYMFDWLLLLERA